MCAVRCPGIPVPGSTWELWGLNAICELLGSIWAVKLASWETCQPQVLWTGRTRAWRLLVSLGNGIHWGSGDLKYLSHLFIPEYSQPYIYSSLNLRHIEEQEEPGGESWRTQILPQLCSHSGVLWVRCVPSLELSFGGSEGHYWEACSRIPLPFQSQTGSS